MGHTVQAVKGDDLKYTKGQSSLQELTGVVIVCDDSQYTKNDMQYLRIALSDCEGTYGDGSTRSRDEFAFNLFQGGGMDTLCDLLDVDEIEERATKNQKGKKNMKDKKSIIVKGKPISLRGRTFEGTIINMNLQKTVTVEWQRQYYLPKYERFEKRRTRVKAHKPDSLNVEIGDQVKIMETRPISKTKHFVIVEVMNDESSKS